MVTNHHAASSTRAADRQQAVVGQDRRLAVAEGVGDALPSSRSNTAPV